MPRISLIGFEQPGPSTAPMDSSRRWLSTDQLHSHPDLLSGWNTLSAHARDTVRTGPAQMVVFDVEQVTLSALSACFFRLLELMPGLLAAHDLDATRLYDRSAVEGLGSRVTWPDVFGVDSVADPGAPGWVHTHGLSRFGMPELELFDVPPETRAEGVLSLLEAVVAEFSVRRPDEGSAFVVADRKLLWLRRSAALARVQTRCAVLEAADHGRESAVLFRPRWPWGLANPLG